MGAKIICDRVQALNTIRKSKSGKLALAMIGRGRPVVVKGPDRLPGKLRSGPLHYASLDIVEWLTA